MKNGDILYTMIVQHKTEILLARKNCSTILQNFYNINSDFINLFIKEYEEYCKRSSDVSSLLKDAIILLQTNRKQSPNNELFIFLPQTEHEKLQFTIHSFLLLRELLQKIENTNETFLPFKHKSFTHDIDNILDLSECRLIFLVMLFSFSFSFLFFLFRWYSFISLLFYQRK